MINKSTKVVFKFGVRQKVLLVLMVVLLTALSVSGWFALEEEKSNILQEVNQRGADISRIVAQSLVYSVVGYDYHAIDLLLKEIIKSDDVDYTKVVNLKKHTMAEVGYLINDDPSKMVIFHEEIVLEEDVVGYLMLGFSTTKTMSRLKQQKNSLIKREAFIILLIALGEFIALSFIIIKPVSKISESLQKNNSDDEGVIGKIEITSNDEFGELARKFNDLSKNLNIANFKLQSRVEYADQELIKTNKLLLERSKELLVLNDEFKKLSVTDSLTGLYNRRYFEEKIKEEMDVTKRHGDSNSILVIDIDHFKKINDTYGHMQGDIVIKNISHIMKIRLRETDILCRVGGEEFVAICLRSDEQASITLAEDLRKTIEEQVVSVENEDVSVTISIGIMTVTKDNINNYANNIFKYADIALYHSKSHGRNRVTHYSDIG